MVVILAVVIGIVTAAVLVVGGGSLPTQESVMNGPVVFALNNLILAATIPLALLTSWAVYRQRPRWLSSVVGGFRWRPFWQFVVIAAAVMVLAAVIEAQFTGGFGELTWGADSLFLIAVIVFTTPFQAAGEEYMTRGLLGRSVGSWFSNRWVALVVSTTVSSVVFMLLHGAGDPWLNAYYLLAGASFAVLAWRTGGLEAAIAFHIVNNMVSEALLPFSPGALDHIFDRQAGVAGPETLIQMGVTVLVAGLLLWQSSRLGLQRVSSRAAGVK